MRMGKIARAVRARVTRTAERVKSFLYEYAYLMTLSAALIVVAASALYTRQLREQTQVQAAADAPEVEQTAQPTEQPAVTPIPLATMAPLKAVSASGLGGTAVKPVDGETLREFEKQTPVYWETLRCYKPHAALDLAGKPGEDVRLAKDGTVCEAVRDELWGWRVTVRQTDGQTAVYAGLESADVAVGQNVTRGQTLGPLMQAIPCEAELGAHLHLELRNGAELCDPAAILP